ncbi:MAG: hypothetical protein RBS08_07575 [Bdellovibrionales bacterium]|jgi:gas vesicle protein|nr:hypothetical protein [Bdellovibrionales bacterium]
MNKTVLAAVALVLAITVAFLVYDRTRTPETPLEAISQSIENAADDLSNNAEDALDTISKNAEEATEEISNSAEEAAEEVRDEIDDHTTGQ